MKSLLLHRNSVEQRQMDENQNILQTSALGITGFYAYNLGLRPRVLCSVCKPDNSSALVCNIFLNAPVSVNLPLVIPVKEAQSDRNVYLKPFACRPVLVLSWSC